MKCKITFLGGDEGGPNPKSVVWGEGKDAITWKVDEPQEFDTDHPEKGELNKEIIKRAQGNRFFRVELVPQDTPVPEGKKSPVDPIPVTKFDSSKEAMETDPLPTEKFKEDQAKRDAAQASKDATAASRKLADRK